MTFSVIASITKPGEYKLKFKPYDSDYAVVTKDVHVEAKDSGNTDNMPGDDTPPKTPTGGGGGSSEPTYEARTLSDTTCGVEISGDSILSKAKLSITGINPHTSGCEICAQIRDVMDKDEYVIGYDIGFNSKDAYQGLLVISIYIGEQFNGRTATVMHCANKQADIIKVPVENGKVIFTAVSLSPFAITINDESIVSAFENPFTDINESDCFYNDVLDCYIFGLMNGTSDTTFSPYAPMTRAMMVTILWRMEGAPTGLGYSEFFDVPEGQWYSDAIIWASQNGIVNGFGNGKFGPSDPLTRLQMVSILHRYAGLKGMNTSDSGSANNFADASSMADWGKNAVSWAVDNGIVNGIGGNMFSPNGIAQRAQFAAIIQRFMFAM